MLSWTGGWLLLWGTGAVLLLPLPRLRLRWRHGSVRCWARGLVRLLGMRRQVLGRPPRAPFLLVSNHLSYLDILLLSTCVDGVFVAKRDMRSWPVLGSLAQLVGTIWVRREVRRDAVRVLERIGAAIARGDGVILFPEGTTSSGAGLLPLKPALLEWAARERYPVHYAAISYRTAPGEPPASLALCWWGTMAFGSHVRNLLRMRYFDARIDFATEPVMAPTRTELAERLRRVIAARLGPVETPDRHGPFGASR
jgi:1-acyl-sn-glycerol-3-phosphate acyltransferase